jgi:hypothetical protein
MVITNIIVYLCVFVDQVLSAKLMEDQPGKEKLDTIKLYEGSIAEYYPELQGVDVAVCIEVDIHFYLSSI